jgi:hypothetical protein
MPGSLYLGAVALEVGDLLHEALALPDDERATLAAELLASLDPPVADDAAAVGPLWSEELSRRAKQVMADDPDSEDWTSIRQRLAAELGG